MAGREGALPRHMRGCRRGHRGWTKAVERTPRPQEEGQRSPGFCTSLRTAGSVSHHRTGQKKKAQGAATGLAVLFLQPPDRPRGAALEVHSSSTTRDGQLVQTRRRSVPPCPGRRREGRFVGGGLGVPRRRAGGDKVTRSVQARGVRSSRCWAPPPASDQRHDRRAEGPLRAGCHRGGCCSKQPPIPRHRSLSSGVITHGYRVAGGQREPSHCAGRQSKKGQSSSTAALMRVVIGLGGDEAAAGRVRFSANSSRHPSGVRYASGKWRVPAAARPPLRSCRQGLDGVRGW